MMKVVLPFIPCSIHNTFIHTKDQNFGLGILLYLFITIHYSSSVSNLFRTCLSLDDVAWTKYVLYLKLFNNMSPSQDGATFCILISFPKMNFYRIPKSTKSPK